MTTDEDDGTPLASSSSRGEGDDGGDGGGSPPVDLRPWVPQPHGGMLRPGGKPGNKSAKGRTTIARRLALAGVIDAIPRMVDLANGRNVTVTTREGQAIQIDATPHVQVTAFKALAEVGFVKNGLSVTELRERLVEQQSRLLDVLRRLGVPAPQQEIVVQAVAAAWRD